LKSTHRYPFALTGIIGAIEIVSFDGNKIYGANLKMHPTD
jgi:hypothetical protein